MLKRDVNDKIKSIGDITPSQYVSCSIHGIIGTSIFCGESTTKKNKKFHNQENFIRT